MGHFAIRYFTAGTDQINFYNLFPFIFDFTMMPHLLPSMNFGGFAYSSTSGWQGRPLLPIGQPEEIVYPASSLLPPPVAHGLPAPPLAIQQEASVGLIMPSAIGWGYAWFDCAGRI